MAVALVKCRVLILRSVRDNVKAIATLFISI